ncbi:peroxidase-related enzyme [Blastococcus sp. TML/M2B]|uniref:peroxidase-related enzyme n=1 Tax=Blastococcus sp. TML/M2B TaxID=2798727 RepID=UPI001F5B13AD|nr:peroxidase-related enzyme [Blastococcus sp. TML/M2B]
MRSADDHAEPHPAAGGAPSRFPLADPAGLPPDLAERYADVEERSGFLPNVFAALAWRPDEARAFFALNDALMDKDTPGLSTGERELIVVATSAANDCAYCVVAHGAIARIRTKDPTLADLVAVDWRKAPLEARMHAVLDVAVRLAVEPASVTAAGPRPAPRPRPDRGRRLGRGSDHRLLRVVEPAGALRRDPAQPRVPPARPAAPLTLTGTGAAPGAPR